MQSPMNIENCIPPQGRPVHVLYDAYMHHGQNRGKDKNRKKIVGKLKK